MTGLVAIPSLRIDFDGHVYQEKLHLLRGADGLVDPYGLTGFAPAIWSLWVLLAAVRCEVLVDSNERDLVKIEFST